MPNATHRFSQRIAMLGAALLQACAAAPLETTADGRMRAIFCGDEGTETSAAYARALARDIDALTKQGLGVAQAIARLESLNCSD